MQQRVLQGHVMLSPETVIHRPLPPETPIRPTHIVTTAEILDNLCAIEKGWPGPTLSVTPTTRRAA